MERESIPYVRSGVYSPPYPAVPLKDLTLEEIKKKYLSMCAKANGSVSVCSKCTNPCEYGKRATQLVANEVYNDPPIPLYGGKTLIERAKEENMLRRKQKEEQEAKEVKPKRKYKHEEWWDESLTSGDQLAWVMKKFGLNKTQAKKKIYTYRYRNGLTDKTYLTKERKRSEPVITCTTNVPEDKSFVAVEALKPDSTQPVCIPSVFNAKHESNTESFEIKMETLMKQQEKYKQLMIEYQEQYEKAKQDYDLLSKKIDILCSAMDIMNE